MPPPATRSLTDLLDRIEAAGAQHDPVAVRDVLNEIGDRSITPFMLVVAVLLVSPISGVPGVPTFSACLIVLLALQALRGQRKLWLPGFMMRQSLSADRLVTMVDWLRRPCAFIDHHTRPRLRFLTVGPARFLTLVACVLIPLGWPLLELLPFVATTGALTVALLVFGLFTHDGLYVLAGYGMVALTLGSTLLLLL